MSDKDSVDARSVVYARNDAVYEMIDTLLGGTPAMRSAGGLYLPREPAEALEKYDYRLKRSFLYNAYRDTIKHIACKPFAREVLLTGADSLNDEALSKMQDDVDRRGTNLTRFAKNFFLRAVHYGMAAILVDHPSLPETPAGALRPVTIADEERLGLRPFFAVLTPTNILGVKTSVGDGGAPRITEIRFLEQIVEPYGKYGDREVNYVRVYRERDWELHRKDPDTSRWVLYRQGKNSLGEVPVVPCYTNQTGFFSASPPMEDMAWLNIEHWQQASDQMTALRVARIGIFVATGFNEEEQEKLGISPTNLWASENKDAKASVVEHSGSSITAGADHVRNIEERMVVMGLRPFVEASGNATATGRVIDSMESSTAILDWVRELERTLLDAYKLAAKWRKQDLPEDFGVDIHSDFGLSARSREEVASLITARKMREITGKTFLLELKRRGLLIETFDVEEELEAVAEERDQALEVTRGMFGPPTEGEEEDGDVEEEESTESNDPEGTAA